ncbi:MAG TPA: tRNA lysidine(34) synthetase TilS [Candidatus Nanopelagicales bacterium]|nr:tRNA lysidine(34) synthetase TilS [Candidatus Nanopelagicales bacterium]
MTDAAAVAQAVRAALDDLDPDSLVLVACSGGADSLALADGVRRTRARAGAVVVDHGLQDGSRETAERVGAWLREQGLDPVEVVTVDVGTAGGPENAARDARYAALHEAADRLGAAAVVLGHTLDDQAETVLLALARGSGTRSLAGMAAARGPFRRPLLGLRRDVVRAAVPAGAPVVADPHNDDRRYSRVRVRHDVLPVLEGELGPGIAEALARTASLARDDADLLDSQAAEAFSVITSGEPAGLGSDDLAALPQALRSRVVRRWLVDGGVPAGALAAEHVERVLRLVTSWRGQGAVALPGGVEAARSYGRLHLRPTPPREES